MSDKGTETKLESAGVSQPPTFGQKLKTHFRRWWWAHLAFFCASVLIIALCL